VIIRLVLGPILAFLLIYLFRFHGVIAQTVLISYSVPTAVNTALIAVECNNNQSFASQVVMMSTVFSAATLSIAIFAARILFPV
jgi:predicted permease